MARVISAGFGAGLPCAVVIALSLSHWRRDFGAPFEGQRDFVLHNGFFVGDGLELF